MIFSLNLEWHLRWSGHRGKPLRRLALARHCLPPAAACLMDPAHGGPLPPQQPTYQLAYRWGQRTLNGPHSGSSVPPSQWPHVAHTSHHLPGQSSAPSLWVHKVLLLRFSTCPPVKGWEVCRAVVRGTGSWRCADPEPQLCSLWLRGLGQME